MNEIMERRILFKGKIRDLAGLDEMGYLSEKGKEALKDLMDEEKKEWKIQII